MNLDFRRSLSSGLFVMGAFFSSSAFSEFSFSTNMANTSINVGETYSFSSLASESCSFAGGCETTYGPHWEFSVLSSADDLLIFTEADGNEPLPWSFTTAAPDTYTLQLKVEAFQIGSGLCDPNGCADEPVFLPYSETFTRTLSVVNLDEVSPVPEPETYAMLLAGLGMLGFAARRRKLKGAVAA